MRPLSVANSTLNKESDPRRRELVVNSERDPTLPQVVPGEFLIKFKPGTNSVAISNTVNRMSLQSARSFRSFPGLRRVKLAPGVEAEAALADYRAQPEVEYVEPNLRHLAARLGAGLGQLCFGPVLVDVDHDGLDEIFLSEGDFKLHAYHSDGRLLAGFPAFLISSHVGQNTQDPFVVDIDSDGEVDLVTGSGNSAGTVIAAFHGDGTTVPGFPFETDEDLIAIGAGDVDGDGRNELVYLTQHIVGPEIVTAVAIYSDNGQLERAIDLPNTGFPTVSSGVLADLTQDGIPEIIAITNWFNHGVQRVHAITGLGATVPGWPVILAAQTGDAGSSMVVGDVDGVAGPEVVLVAYASLHVLKANGTYAAGFPKEQIQTSAFKGQITPAIADIDNDGRNEIIVTTDFSTGFSGYFEKVRVYDLGGPTPHGPLEWGQTLENAAHHGYYKIGKNLPNHAFLNAHVRGSGSITSAPAGISCGTDCIEKYAKGTQVTLTAVPSPGGALAQWFGACAGQGNPCTINVQDLTTVTADFTTKTLSVVRAGTGSGTVTSNPAGINCGTDCSETYSTQVVVTLTAAAAANSDFIGWSGACAGVATTCSVTLDTAKSVTANFNLKPTLTVTKSGPGTATITSNPGGINCGGDCSETYTVNTVVTLSLALAADSQFDGWSGACSGTGTCTVTMSAAKSVNANMTLKPVLTVATTGSGTVTSNPAGINCGADCTEPFATNTAVTLTATPAAGSQFLGWAGGCNGKRDYLRRHGEHGAIGDRYFRGHARSHGDYSGHRQWHGDFESGGHQLRRGLHGGLRGQRACLAYRDGGCGQHVRWMVWRVYRNWRVLCHG